MFSFSRYTFNLDLELGSHEKRHPVSKSIVFVFSFLAPKETMDKNNGMDCSWLSASAQLGHLCELLKKFAPPTSNDTICKLKILVEEFICYDLGLKSSSTLR